MFICLFCLFVCLFLCALYICNPPPCPLGTSGVSLMPPCWVFVSVDLCFHFGSVCLWVCLSLFSVSWLFFRGPQIRGLHVPQLSAKATNRYLKGVHEAIF